MFDRLARTAGHACRPHMLRHSAVTRWLRDGVDRDVVQRLLGHASSARRRGDCCLPRAVGACTMFGPRPLPSGSCRNAYFERMELVSGVSLWKGDRRGEGRSRCLRCARARSRNRSLNSRGT
ncbi:site-specific integrase [Streptomyces sp. NPDC002596]